MASNDKWFEKRTQRIESVPAMLKIVERLEEGLESEYREKPAL
jgi:hypothetical protein